MQLANLKISIRLGLLGAFFFFALVFVGVRGWSALDAASARSAQAMQRSVALTEAVDAARSAQVEFKIQVQEWKNILLRGGDAAAFRRYREAFVASGAQTRKELAGLQAMMAALKLDTAPVAQALQAHDALGVSYLAALQQYDGARADSAHTVDALVKGMDREPTRQIDAIEIEHAGIAGRDDEEGEHEHRAGNRGELGAAKKPFDPAGRAHALVGGGNWLAGSAGRRRGIHARAGQAGFERSHTKSFHCYLMLLLSPASLAPGVLLPCAARGGGAALGKPGGDCVD